MDKGAPQKMTSEPTTLVSDRERCTAIRKFIVARYNQELKIEDFTPIANYLNGGDVKFLYRIDPSGFKTVQKYGTYGDFIEKPNGKYTPKDAERYFDWLTSVALGSLKQTSQEVVDDAVDQLAFFILILGENVKHKKHVELLPPYDWQSLLLSFDDRITDLKRSIDLRDAKLTHIMEQVRDWIKEYRQVLDEVKKDYHHKLGKALPK